MFQLTSKSGSILHFLILCLKASKLCLHNEALDQHAHIINIKRSDTIRDDESLSDGIPVEFVSNFPIKRGWKHPTPDGEKILNLCRQDKRTSTCANAQYEELIKITSLSFSSRVSLHF